MLRCEIRWLGGALMVSMGHGSGLRPGSHNGAVQERQRTLAENAGVDPLSWCGGVSRSTEQRPEVQASSAASWRGLLRGRLKAQEVYVYGGISRVRRRQRIPLRWVR